MKLALILLAASAWGHDGAPSSWDKIGEVCYTLVCAEHIPPSIENALALPVSEAERKAGA